MVLKKDARWSGLNRIRREVLQVGGPLSSLEEAGGDMPAVTIIARLLDVHHARKLDDGEERSLGRVNQLDEARIDVLILPDTSGKVAQ
uniref:Uncharacterized protein n=1 Tax=viral metagenome TaxID=1070528 RepID=A0A6H1Z8T1_9ZZZZ